MTPAGLRSAPLHIQQPAVGAVDRGGKQKDCAERSDEAVCAILCCHPRKLGGCSCSNCLSVDVSGYRAKCPVKERHSEMITDSYAVQFRPSLVRQIYEQLTVERNSMETDG